MNAAWRTGGCESCLCWLGKCAKMAVFLSVALCTYNGAGFVEEQLASIAQQRHPPDELVVADDCSTDRTLDILQDFAAKAPFPVTIFCNSNRLGSTKNFDAVIQRCQGDVIALA